MVYNNIMLCFQTPKVCGHLNALSVIDHLMHQVQISLISYKSGQLPFKRPPYKWETSRCE